MSARSVYEPRLTSAAAGTPITEDPKPRFASFKSEFLGEEMTPAERTEIINFIEHKNTVSSTDSKRRKDALWVLKEKKTFKIFSVDSECLRFELAGSKVKLTDREERHLLLAVHRRRK